jgi:chromosome segregation ATPase
MLDPAYSQLLDTNQELRSELRDEIFINKSNEKKIHILKKELEQCFRTISFQDKTIIAHEEEIESLKTEINSLKQHLQKTLQDLRHKGNASTFQDIHILRLEDKVERLKARIRILIDKKISINALDMATANLITNINRGLDRIENHIRGAGTPLQNPFNILDGIRGSLNTIRATLQNITTERDQYQNILNDENRQVRDLRQQLNDSRNQNLRSQRLLDESRTQIERTAKEKDNAQGERDLAILAYNNERKESRRWYFSYRDKDRRVSELLREYFAFRLLIQRKNTQIAEHRRTAHRWTLRYNNDTERWRRAYADSQNRHLKWKGRYRNSQNQIQVQNQNIFNLQQQILVLQNNPLQNMAAIEHVMQMLAPHLASLPDYDG